MAADRQETAELDPGTAGPRRNRARWMLVAALPLAVWLGWFAAMNSSAMQDYQRLRDERSAIQSELEETRLRHQQLEVDLMVARQSVADGQAVIADLEQQLFRLQQDLAQYQGALAPSAAAPGLRIQAFELQRTDVPGVFRCKVMVSRVGNESDTVEARLRLTVLGQQGDGRAEYGLPELTGGRVQYLPLNFRYFQVVPDTEGVELMLPLGFEPKTVQLKVENEGKLLLEQTVEWTDMGVRP